MRTDRLSRGSEVYRDWAYVKNEVLRLAEQLFNPLEALATCLKPLPLNKD